MLLVNGMKLFSYLAGLAIVTAAALGTKEAQAADCQRLSGKTFGSALIVETNDIKPPFVAASMQSQGVSVTTPFCRVRGLGVSAQRRLDGIGDGLQHAHTLAVDDHA